MNAKDLRCHGHLAEFIYNNATCVCFSKDLNPQSTIIKNNFKYTSWENHDATICFYQSDKQPQQLKTRINKYASSIRGPLKCPRCDQIILDKLQFEMVGTIFRMGGKDALLEYIKLI